MVGCHHWLDEHEFEQALRAGDVQGSLACCSPWGHKGSNRTKWLNWTDWVEPRGKSKKVTGAGQDRLYRSEVVGGLQWKWQSLEQFEQRIVVSEMIFQKHLSMVNWELTAGGKLKGRRPIWKLSKNPSRRQQWPGPGQPRRDQAGWSKRWAALGCMLMTEAEKFTGSLDTTAWEKKKRNPECFQGFYPKLYVKDDAVEK